MSETTAARKLRIVLVAFACDPEQGSEPGTGWGWAEALAKRGHTVEILTHPEGDNAANIARRIRELGPAGERINTHVIPLPPSPSWTNLLPGTVRSMVTLFLRYGGWQRRALELAREQGFDRADLIHHVSFGSLEAGCALRRLGPPLVFGPVGGGQVAPHSHRRFLGTAYWQEAFRAAVWVRGLSNLPSCRATLRQAAVVLTTNRDTRALAHRRGHDGARLMLADGIDRARIRSSATDGPAGHARPRTVLWVGSLIPRKAPGLALHALAHLRRDVPDARLVVVGDGPLQPELQRLAARLGLSDAVDFRGLLPWEEALAAYDDAGVFVMTSLRDSSGGQVLEAYARGLPVVHLDHQGIGDFSAPGGALPVALGDPEDLPQRLAAALGAVLLDQPRFSRMAAAGPLWAERHTWAAKAEAVEELYASALRRERAPSPGESPRLRRTTERYVV